MTTDTCCICHSPDIQMAVWSCDKDLWTYYCPSHLPALTPMESRREQQRLLDLAVDTIDDFFPEHDPDKENGV